MGKTKWSGTSGAIAKYVRAESERAIRAYAEYPSRVQADANQEQDTARGGYANRQVVELVQNSADQIAKIGEGRILIRLTDTHLYCADNGAPFDEDGASALLLSHLSPKRETAEIGRFGVGFKSVLRITDSPAVFSRSGSIQFDRERARRLIQQVAPGANDYPVLHVADPIDPWREADSDEELHTVMDWAVNVVRLPLKPGVCEDLMQQLESFRAEFLLFVPHVQQLDLIWQDAEGEESERPVRLIESGGEFELSDGLRTSQWVVFEREHQLSLRARADSRALDDAERVRIAWAAPRTLRGAGQEFWAYFPTQSSSLLAGILNAPWKTNEDRQNLLPGPYNDELVDAAAPLVADNLHHLRSDDQPAQHLDYLPRRYEFGDAAHADRLRRSIYRRLETAAVIPDQVGDLQPFVEVHIPPDELTPGQRVESEIVRLWSGYQHKPSDWLHDDALASDRLSVIARVGDGGRTTRGNLMRTSVAQWLGALVRSGAEHGDFVDASATAIAIAGMMRKMVVDGASFGGIVLTNSGDWAQPIPDQLFLGADQAAGSANTVHAELMSRPDVEQALLTLGIRPPSAESAFRGLVAALFSAARSEEQWKDFWRLSREVDQNFATRLVRGSTGWCQKVRALALDGEWRPISMLLLPGPIVPADRSRDATVAIDTEFHLQDLAFFRHLGVASAPRAVQASDHTPSILIDFRDRCFNEYRKFVRPQRPRNHLLSIYSNQDVEPLDAFAALSDTGRVAFTEAVLDLPATYDRWEVAHKNRDKYPVMAVKSYAVAALEQLGLVRIDNEIHLLADGLGDEPKNPEVRRWLLQHPKTHQIRQAFGIRVEAGGQAAAVDEDEPLPLVDVWPGLSEYLSEEQSGYEFGALRTDPGSQWH